MVGERVGVVVVVVAATEQSTSPRVLVLPSFLSLRNSRRAAVDAKLYTPTLKIDALRCEKKGFIATQASLFCDAPACGQNVGLRRALGRKGRSN